MFVNRLSQSNAVNFNGYINIAGGKKVDKKAALVNKKMMQNLQPVTKESKPNSVLLFFAGLFSVFGFKNPLNKLLSK